MSRTPWVTSGEDLRRERLHKLCVVLWETHGESFKTYWRESDPVTRRNFSLKVCPTLPIANEYKKEFTDILMPELTINSLGGNDGNGLIDLFRIFACNTYEDVMKSEYNKTYDRYMNQKVFSELPYKYAWPVDDKMYKTSSGKLIDITKSNYFRDQHEQQEAIDSQSVRHARVAWCTELRIKSMLIFLSMILEQHIAHVNRSTVGTRTVQALGCRYCGNRAEKKCKGCNMLYYCSRGCQRADWKKHSEKCKKKEKDYEIFKLRVHDPAKTCPIKLVHPKIVEQVKRLGGNFLEIARMDYKHSLDHEIRVQPWAQAVVNIQFPKNRKRLGSEKYEVDDIRWGQFCIPKQEAETCPELCEKDLVCFGDGDEILAIRQDTARQANLDVMVQIINDTTNTATPVLLSDLLESMTWIDYNE